MSKNRIRYLRVASFYPDMISHFFESKQWETADYEASKLYFLNQCYGQSDFHENVLNRIGYEANVIIYDADFIQEKWDMGGLYLDRFRRLLKQLEAFSPVVLYIENIFLFTSEELEEIRKKTPSIRLLVGFLGSAFTNRTLSLLRSYDFVVTCDPELQQKFLKAGIDTLLIMHAFDPLVLDRIGTRSASCIPASFVGSLVAGEQFHTGRIELLNYLVEHERNLAVFGRITRGTNHLRLLMGRMALTGNIWEYTISRLGFRIPRLLRRAQAWVPREEAYVTPALKAAAMPPVYGLEMYKTLQNSRVTLNATISTAKNIANMRLFEATGVGTCVLTDTKENLEHLFEPGKEVVPYKSKEECAELLGWLLQNPSAAEEIGRRGQRRCLSEHKYSNRTPLLDRKIRERLRN